MSTLADKLEMLYEQKGIITKPVIKEKMNDNDYHEVNELLENYEYLEEGLFDNLNNLVQKAQNAVPQNTGDASNMDFKKALNYGIDGLKNNDKLEGVRNAFSDMMNKTSYHKTFIESIKDFFDKMEWKFARTFNPKMDLHLEEQLRTLFHGGEIVSGAALLFLIGFGSFKLYKYFFKSYSEECKKLSGDARKNCQKLVNQKTIQSQIKELENTKKLANKTDNPAKFKAGIDKQIQKLKKKL